MNRSENSRTYDVAVIGAGVVGCAIARHLARFELDCALIEAGPDVGTGTSKANTAILHTGFDSKPDTLENGLVRRGYALLQEYAAETGIPLEPAGGLLVAWDAEQEAALPRIREIAAQNGVDVRPVSRDELYRLEPELGEGALAGLHIPGESIICPFTTTLAYATQAVINGVALLLDAPVREISTVNGLHRISVPEAEIRCRWMVNAAGVNSDLIDGMMGHAGFAIRPRRGELLVFDKFASALVRHILLPVPGVTGKGVLVSPTVYGNVLLGPTSEHIEDKQGTETTAAGLASLLEKGRRILPALMDEEITAAYAGIRAASGQDDYQIHSHPEQRYVCVGGIRSTGLTASMAIAEYVVDRLADQGLRLKLKPEFRPVQMPYIGEVRPRPYQSEALIAQDPAYGEIVCHCEKVTRGEIKATFSSPLPPPDLDGLRRRTRALMGRCQGFYCHANVLAQFQEGQKIQTSAGSLREI
jgi:glycerol-3-phosphate dehydrogenase